MSEKPRIAIIGGGFTGAATAIHLSRSAPAPLAISVIEPRPEVGRGVAYSATDPDHRINAPSGFHFLYPEDPDGIENWLRKTGRFDRDDGIAAFDGALFPRREDVGAYFNSEFVVHIQDNPSMSDVEHIRQRAVQMAPAASGFTVTLEDGTELAADLVIVTTSNEAPNVPTSIDDALRSHPGFIADPWDIGRLKSIDSNANVMILGAGLTAADVISTLVRDKSGVKIDAVSRSGIRPTSRPRSHASLPQPIWDRTDAKPSPFEKKYGTLKSVRKILSVVREEIATNAEKGIPWQPAFDDVRDSLRQIALALPLEEKKRFQRHLRRRYDSCRFRYPPQNDEILSKAEASGQLTFHLGNVGHIAGKEAAVEVGWTKGGVSTVRDFDAVINCVGPPSRPDRSDNPFLKSIIAEGHARVAPLGVGLDVDDDCRAVDGQGQSQSRLFVVGPLTFARFGYPLGIPFIVHQIVLAMPGMFDELSGPISRS